MSADCRRRASGSLSAIERDIPFQGPMTTAGEQREEDFKRRLMSPYREADFWHEAVKRLAAVKLGVNEAMWRDLMRGRPLPDGVADVAEAWRQLTDKPWVRPRANGSAVTLHDAMAEELARQVIPLHDQDRQWRKEMWARAVANCDVQITELQSAYDTAVERLKSRRQLVSGSPATGQQQRLPHREPRADRPRIGQARCSETNNRPAKSAAVLLSAAVQLRGWLPTFP